MHNSYLSKWLMFISSYFPLYLWLICINVPWRAMRNLWAFDTRSILIMVLIVLSVISAIQVIVLLRGNGSERKPVPQNLEINPESDSLMNYIITYITPFLTLDINRPETLWQNLFLFVVIGLIYAGSSATFLNPLLGVLGFKVFGVSGSRDAHHIISSLSFDEIQKAQLTQDDLRQYRIGEGVYIIRNVQK